MEEVSPQRQGSGDDEGTDRINALSDGVFAIAITLLVLNIGVPDDIPADRVAQDLPGRLDELIPELLSYAISFLVIGSYWMAHRAIFQKIRAVDRGLMWLNILFLMFVAFLPFPTALLDEYPNDQLPVALYAGSLAVARLPLTAIWWYATHNRRLVHEHLDARTVRWHRIRGLGIPLIFLLSIGVSFISLTTAKLTWILLFVIDIVILEIDRSR